MLTTNRDLFDSNASINLIISFDKSIKNIYIREISVSWYYNQKLETIFKNFLRTNNIQLKGKYFLYLKRNGKILKRLKIGNKISHLKLESNDEIIVSYENLIIFEEPKEINKQEILTIKEKFEENKRVEENKGVEEIKEEKFITKIKENDNKETIDIESLEEQKKKMKIDEEKEKELYDNINDVNNFKTYNEKIPIMDIKKLKNKKRWVFIGLIILITLLVLGISTYFIIKHFIKQNIVEEEDIPTEIITDMPIVYTKEDLIINKKYPLNLLLRFNMVKKNRN